jgi:ankyrin repeat protein
MVENVKFAKTLIDAGADIYYKDDKSVSTLLQACHRGLAEVAKLLIDKHQVSGKDNAFLDAASDEGISPLIAASSEGHLDVVKLLIASGANVDCKDQDDTTALMAASARGHLDAVKELVAAGAKVNEQNRDGHSALMFAYNGKNQVETLWERFNQFKAEQPDKFSDDGGSGPLLREALNNHTALVDLLLKNGADSKLKDKEGHMAKDFDYHPDADSEILDKVVKKEASKDESRSEL